MFQVSVVKGNQFSPFFDEKHSCLYINEENFYQILKIIANASNASKSTNNAFHQGHRKQIFTENEKNEIRYKYTHFNISKRQLARSYKCSEATIRRILKTFSED